MKNAILRTSALASAIACCLPTSAYAQLEEILVTATRRETNLQETPLSIQAFTAEQLELGRDDLDDAKRLLAATNAVFGDAYYASVVLLTAATGLTLLLLLATLAGRRSRMRAAGVFGVIAVAELHHVVETIARRAYSPGTASAVLLASAGALLLHTVGRELKASAPSPLWIGTRPKRTLLDRVFA